MRIHKEGRKIVGISFLLLAVFNLAIFFLADWGIVFLLILISSAIILFSLWGFFRDPIRDIEVNDQYIFAPADGKVVVIEQTDENEFFNAPRIQVSIFMSPLNVHSNRNPISGEVKYVKYHKGKYLVAWHPKSSTQNESNSVVISNSKVELMVKQIAGAMARRIINYLKVGDDVVQGQDFGFIRFGSRVDVYLPLDSHIEVKISQRVRSGKTVIATVG